MRLRAEEVGCLALLAIASATAPCAWSQAYPSKSIRVIVAQSPGSASDIVARAVTQQMGAILGQTFVVDTRPGAGGVTGAELGARAAPDGYTVLITSISTHGTVPALYKKLSFDPVKDFTPVGRWVTIPNMLVVHPSLPVRSTGELITLAKTRPGQLNVGMQGNGSSQHLATELFKLMAGNLDVVLVPYKGSGPMIIGLVGGEVSFLFPTLSLSRPHIQAGKVRAIAVATA
jgi:tripartite-type tricarboxylate transporter receptor subunit TctC